MVNAVTNLILLSVVATLVAQPISESKVDDAKDSIWKGTPVDTLVQEYQEECSQESESSACLKLKVLNFVDVFFSKDNFKVSTSMRLFHFESFDIESATFFMTNTISLFFYFLPPILIGNFLVFVSITRTCK